MVLESPKHCKQFFSKHAESYRAKEFEQDGVSCVPFTVLKRDFGFGN